MFEALKLNEFILKTCITSRFHLILRRLFAQNIQNLKNLDTFIRRTKERVAAKSKCGEIRIRGYYVLTFCNFFQKHFSSKVLNKQTNSMAWFSSFVLIIVHCSETKYHDIIS